MQVCVVCEVGVDAPLSRRLRFMVSLVGLPVLSCFVSSWLLGPIPPSSPFMYLFRDSLGP